MIPRAKLRETSSTSFSRARKNAVRRCAPHSDPLVMGIGPACSSLCGALKCVTGAGSMVRARGPLPLVRSLARMRARFPSHLRIRVCICSTDDASRRHLSRPAHLCVVHVLCPLGHQRRRGRSESAHGHGARSSVVFVVARPVPSRGEEKRREERRRGLTVRAFVRVRRAVRAG